MNSITTILAPIELQLCIHYLYAKERLLLLRLNQLLLSLGQQNFTWKYCNPIQLIGNLSILRQYHLLFQSKSNFNSTSIPNPNSNLNSNPDLIPSTPNRIVSNYNLNLNLNHNPNTILSVLPKN